MIPAGMPMGFLDKFLDWHLIYFVDYNRQNRHVFAGYNRYRGFCSGFEGVAFVPNAGVGTNGGKNETYLRTRGGDGVLILPA